MKYLLCTSDLCVEHIQPVQLKSIFVSKISTPELIRLCSSAKKSRNHMTQATTYTLQTKSKVGSGSPDHNPEHAGKMI